MKTMLVGMGMVVAAASLGLVACGSDSPTANSSPVIDVGATNFVTIPPVPVTEPPITTAPDAPGSILEFETEYTVVEGDYPSTVASKFKVDFQEFMTLNNFTLVGQVVPEWTGPGQVVKIPPGATVPGEPVATVATTVAPGTETTETTEAPEATTATTDPPDTTTTTSDCTPGSYEILPDDTSRQKVADKFDVSVAALDNANANTNGYSSFYAGLKIVIPC